MRARVMRSSQRHFTCQVNAGEDILATAMGKLLKKDSIVVGDWVELTQDGEQYQIVSVEKRENEIYRMLQRERKKKVSASNVDCFIILSSVSSPVFKRGVVDRFLVRSRQWNIQPLVIFNKIDEYQSSDVDLKFEFDRLQYLGVECFFISAKKINFPALDFFNNGFDELKSHLANKTTIFLGQSGVGKSTLINLLSDGKVDLKSLEVGKVGKGKHTTTWTELIELPNFSLIDSPGVRSFSLDDIDPDDLIRFFPDLSERALKCKFSSCQHNAGIKGCYFFHNDWDEFKRSIILSRLDSYLKIKNELEEKQDY